MRIFQDDGVPGAAKKQGDSACLARTGQARRALLWLFEK
jgi:hypothetical protein